MKLLPKAFILTALSISLPAISLPAPAAELVVPDTAPRLNTSPLLEAASPTGILSADQAFPLVAQAESDGSITLFWQLAPGYYLYQKSLAVTQADGKNLQLELPEATQITDEYFGEVAVYYERLVARVSAAELKAEPGTTAELLLSFQGCAQDLYCYPLQQKTLTLQLPD